jgi:predicted Zn-dependent protease with MMP-like domain
MALLEETLADDYDIEIELERKELIELLDRAMALLPQEIRTVLVKRYVEESPLAEVAAQLGTNTSAVAMRLQRGKLALRRVLTKEMSEDISPYRVSTTDEWEETPLWCHSCGQRRLLGRRNPDEGELLLKCPTCSPAIEDLVSQNHLPVLRGLKGYKPLLSRLMLWCHGYYRAGLSNDTVFCEDCGNRLSVQVGLPPHTALTWIRKSNERMVNIVCTFCTSTCTINLEELVLALPEGRQFMRRYPRIRTLPKQYVEAEGCSAIATRFESITDNVQLTVVSAYNTYEVLRVYGGCG